MDAPRQPTLRPGAASTTKAPPAVLIVDDEENILRSLRRLFRGEAFRTIATTDPYEALSCLHDGPVAVLVTDQRMRDLDGDHLIARVKALDERIVCIRLTGYPHAGGGAAGPARTPPREAVFRTIEKPWDDADILNAVHEAIALYERRAGCSTEGISTGLPPHIETHEREEQL
ncbi:MAG: response regulator [Verrucomicrobia bacterium]|nr:response regulator [Verrucomicrobiota bacterium]